MRSYSFLLQIFSSRLEIKYLNNSKTLTTCVEMSLINELIAFEEMLEEHQTLFTDEFSC